MESLMKHFAAEEWIDFVRQVVRTIGKEKMKEHLEQGCKSCSNYRPPGDAVRIAKASFAGSNLAGEQKRRDSLAELLFDSFLRPALEGARSSSIGTRQML